MTGPDSPRTIASEVVAPLDLARRAAAGWVAVVLLLVAAGAAVTVLVDHTVLGPWDLDITRWMSEHRTGVLDSAATVGSSLTDTFTVLGVLVGAVTMLAASGHLRHGLVLIVAVTTEFTVFFVTSLVVDRARPDVDALGSVPSTASFPSGHVAAAIALYGGLALVATSLTGDRRVGRIGGGLAALAAFWVGLARLYEGVHHPLDVAGGVLLGVAALAAAAWSGGLLPARTATAAAPVVAASPVASTSHDRHAAGASR